MLLLNNEEIRNKNHEVIEINPLYGENIANGEDHSINSIVNNHNDASIEKNFTISSIIKLEVEYSLCNTIKTNYVFNVSKNLITMKDSKHLQIDHKIKNISFQFSNLSHSKQLLKKSKNLNKPHINIVHADTTPKPKYHNIY